MTEEIQRQYEITFILSPELKEEDINSFGEEIKASIEKLGGSLKKIGKPEKRNLAYPIKKFQSGYYLAINSLLIPEKLKELSSNLKHKKEILRYITVLALEEKPRPIPKKKIEKKPQPKAGPPWVEKIEKPKEKIEKPSFAKATGGKKKIQLEEIDKKLEEILGM